MKTVILRPEEKAHNKPNKEKDIRGELNDLYFELVQEFVNDRHSMPMEEQIKLDKVIAIVRGELGRLMPGLND